MRWIVVLLFISFGGMAASPNVAAQQRATTTVARDTIEGSDTRSAQEEVDHSRLDHLLRRYVDEDGNVAYAELKAEGDSTLDAYLDTLAEVHPSSLSREARLALWINAYNAYTLQLIVDHYPVQNIWAVTSGPPRPKENSPFALDVGPVADTVRSLDEIEHEIIRKRFDEPRIHFALVCAALSCPKLRREAYTGPKLDRQLDEQARTFLHDDTKNRIPASTGDIEVSRILKWYSDDFGASTDELQHFLAPYFDGVVRDRLAAGAYDVRYRTYDWTLNDQESSAASSR